MTILFVIGGVLFVLMFVAVSMALLAVYSDKGMIRGVRGLRPESVPINLLLPKEFFQDVVQDAKKAIQEFNSRTGRGLVCQIGYLSRGLDVAVRCLPLGPEARIETVNFRHDSEGFITWAEILINTDKAFDPQIYPLLWRVFYHALGHLFGLDHDDSPSSIMFRMVHSGDQGLTDADVELILRGLSKEGAP